MPYPFAADDHQRKNAEALGRRGAARIVTPALRTFATFGRTVDDPWNVGRSRGRSELQLEITLQF